MHKCQNNSNANVHHLEQFIGDFFPYSQKQLGFDKPITIRFESDDENANVLLGKTAYYDPQALEIVLYVDGRHPKDVMRSLSHELVHHAQNCRGDFTGAQDTGAGYAQEDPHLRKMEREAYTKGNLIFRDFEDLIKTGKINIEIDFSGSGEPKMSLKEWKDNELNMLLMKKWGLLKESKEVTTEDTDDLEEGWGYRDEDDLDERQSRRSRKRESDNQRGNQSRSMKDAMDLEEAEELTKSASVAQGRKTAQSEADAEARGVLKAAIAYLAEPGTQNVGVVKNLLTRLEAVLKKLAVLDDREHSTAQVVAQSRGQKHTAVPAADIEAAMTETRGQKISVREAKEITRKIIERIKKESN